LVHPDNQEPEQLEQPTRQVYATAHQNQRLEAGLIRSALKTGDGLALAEDELDQNIALIARKDLFLYQRSVTVYRLPS
jgi:hypothetical protein